MLGHVLAKQEQPYGNNRSYSFNSFGSVFSILCLVDRKLILESKILISQKKKTSKTKEKSGSSNLPTKLSPFLFLR